MMLRAVSEIELDASLLPRELWDSASEVAKRARRTATKRKSELMNFLSWAEWQGFFP
jgi:hypothetical protein